MNKSYHEIKSRINSVNNTLHITNALKAEAASKLRKTQKLAIAGREHLDLLYYLLDEVLKAKPKNYKVSPSMEAFMSGKADSKKIGILVLGSNRGLAGNYNVLLENAIASVYEELKTSDNEVFVFPVGKKVENFAKKMQLNIQDTFEISDYPTAEEAKDIHDSLLNYYFNSDLDRVIVLLHRFYSPGRQEIGTVDYLPFSLNKELKVEARSSSAIVELSQDTVKQDFNNENLDEENPELEKNKKKIKHKSEKLDYEENAFTEFDPDYHSVLENLFSYFLQAFMKQLLTESKGSEQIFRMRAMTQASENAEEMLNDLRIKFNISRQARITEETIEIVNAGLREEKRKKER